MGIYHCTQTAHQSSGLTPYRQSWFASLWQMMHKRLWLFAMIRRHTSADIWKILEMWDRFGKDILMTFIVKSTPSSMHSFSELSRYLNDEPSCWPLLTRFSVKTNSVITWHHTARHWPEGKTGWWAWRTISMMRNRSTWALTMTWASRDFMMTIPTIADTFQGHLRTAGQHHRDAEPLYAEGRKPYAQFPARPHQRRQVLKAYPFSKVLDIDHASDIEKAKHSCMKRNKIIVTVGTWRAFLTEQRGQRQSHTQGL